MKEALVLGSEGLIGRHLFKELEDRGFHCQGIDLAASAEQDLRLENCEPLASVLRSVDLVFFLAFDVGGSRYLAANDRELTFLENNSRILANTFMQIRQH